MEGIAAEVSQKLKAAIKAKLMELGLYVDDQLPNYVMVMVTNRRNKREMDKELQLFLGENTNQFTSWLQSVWQKLEQVTVTSVAKQDLKRKSSSSDTDKKKKKRLKKSQESDSENEKKGKKGKHEEVSDKKNQNPTTVFSEIDHRFDDNSESSIEKYLDVNEENNRFKDNSPDIPVISCAEDNKHSSDKSKTQLPKDFEDDDDFLNIKEDIEDFLSDTEDAIDTVSKSVASKGSVENKANKTAGNVVPKKTLTETKHSVIVNRVINKNVIEKKVSNIDNESKMIKDASNKAKITTSQCVRIPVSSQVEHKDKKLHDAAPPKITNTNLVRNNQKEENLSKTNNTNLIRKNQKDEKHFTKSVKQPLPVRLAQPLLESKKTNEENDNTVDARVVLNRKRDIARAEKISKLDDNDRVSNRRTVVHNINDQKPVNVNLSGHKTLRNVPSSSNRMSDIKVYNIDESDDDEYDMKKSDKVVKDNKYNINTKRKIVRSNRPRDYIPEKSRMRNYSPEHPRTRGYSPERSRAREYSPEMQRTREYSQSDEEIRTNRRTVPERQSSSYSESSGDENMGKRSHIISNEPSEDDSVNKKRKVESVASYPQAPSRPKLTAKESASGNLVRKAFAEVQRSLSKPRSSNKEKGVVRIKRNLGKQHDITGVQTQKPASVTRSSSPPIKEDKKMDSVVKEELKVKDSNDCGWISPKSFPAYIPGENQNNSASHIKEKSAQKSVSDTKMKAVEANVMPEMQKVVPNSAKFAREPVEEYDPEKNMPQFVVTLTGLNPNMYPNAMQQVTADDSNDVEMVEPATDEEMPEVKPSVPKKIERCRFWPNCLNGESCPYIHPTAPCKSFPNCKFGNSCLYIHPKCKFDTMCTRYDCPYLHTDPAMHVVSSSVAMKPSQSYKMSCKFFPNCVNTNCPYQHPKLCRYDKYCTNKVCPFTHTQLNHMHGKLKWTNPLIYGSTSAVTTPSSTSLTTVASAAPVATSAPSIAVASEVSGVPSIPVPSDNMVPS